MWAFKNPKGTVKLVTNLKFVKPCLELLFLKSLLIKRSGIFEVGSGRSVSIKKLAKLFKSKIKFKRAISGEIKNSDANINKIRKILNFKPRTDLQTGIRSL